ncbi:alternative ribosome rescue aminoacyl-tRNA hydrolase ArfB [Aurantibacter sp.]|uniref:alternative ribosome rescue aminoacyl-tRNA hydrolase ArfB n=1 Tax=Aurantibacter sp. TaxID=2807103 RepID=UPI0035C802AF
MLNHEAILKECVFKATTSSGSGGQHVNKVATRIELYFNIEESINLSLRQKERLKSKLKLTTENVLILSSQETRSQYKNKNLTIKKLFFILDSALKVNKYRIPTKTPRSVKVKRLKNKKINSERKSNRKKPSLD